MTRRPRSLAGALALVLATPVLTTTPAAIAACDPLVTPVYAGQVPSPEDVLGFPIGSQEVTVDEIVTYLDAVDAASGRVVTATAATSVQGRPIDYAIVGKASEVSPAALVALREDAAALRDPSTPAGDAEAIVASMPPILWLAANVHGGEESGADASLQVLYDLADRTDCAATAIRDEAVVVIMPTQNPDGRELETRRNAYGFDMNRDWFARTQPETDGKIETLRMYPPMLFIDAHEFGYSNYFFPPNADPEYHETPDTAHRWINELYSPAIASSFDREKIKYFHGAPYDFFASIFGDTVPTVGFHAAGMTFEKESDDRIAVRTREQYLSSWSSLYAGATDPSIVADWRDSYVEAATQGTAGTLEANAVFEDKNELFQEVPDVRVRHYFLEDDPDRAVELQALVRRLQRMDVDVYRLTAPLEIDAFHGYDGSGGDTLGVGTTLPAGTYWVPMAQGQKHWIQSMLHDESWIPYDVTYDVTSWSNPLLMNVPGGWTGEALSPAAGLVAPLGSVPAPALPSDIPSIGLFEIPSSTRGFEAAGHFRWLADTRWHLPYADVPASDIRAGLTGIDVLVIPDGYANYALQALGSTGKKALRAWVAEGGRLVAWQGGAEVAARAGVSTVVFKASHTNMPGSLVRVDLDTASPLAEDVGTTAWVMFDDDDTMTPGLGTAPVSYPQGTPPVSGLDVGVGDLAGTTVVADEAVGAGRVVSFAIDPNFRGWSDGTQRILWNALLGSDPAGATSARLTSERRQAAEREARDAAAALPKVGASPLRVAVAREDAALAAATIRAWGTRSYRMRVADGVLLQVPNLRDLSGEEHTFVDLLDRLTAAGVTIRWASVP